MSELKPCPFCGRTPKVLHRTDSLDGYFCAISCFCGGCSARAHQAATGADESEAYMKAALRWNRRPEPEITGDTSDGYHTFNELYHHRAMLFSVICNDRLDRAWKSKMHHDGTMYDGMFIVGIQTPNGQATYHYDIDPYWDMFRVPELSQAPEWDGHTPAQAIERIGRLTQPENKPLTLHFGDGKIGVSTCRAEDSEIWNELLLWNPHMQQAIGNQIPIAEGTTTDDVEVYARLFFHNPESAQVVADALNRIVDSCGGNKPLTLEELRERKNGPVWAEWRTSDPQYVDGWEIIGRTVPCPPEGEDWRYGETWVAYDRPPKEWE